MKHEKPIIALLAVILIVNIVGVTLHTMEEKKQTDIALKTAELISIQSDITAYSTLSENANAPEMSHQWNNGKNAYTQSEEINRIRAELGLNRINHEIEYKYID